MWQKSCKVLVRLFHPCSSGVCAQCCWLDVWADVPHQLLGRRGQCCEGAGVTLVTPRYCRAPAASLPCSVGSSGIVPKQGNMTTLLMFPTLCRSSAWPWLCHVSPSRLPQAGGAARDAGDQLRPGQVGFAPVGSHSWGAPLVESSAPHLATALFGFATLCLAGSHHPHPNPSWSCLWLAEAGTGMEGL